MVTLSFITLTASNTVGLTAIEHTVLRKVESIPLDFFFTGAPMKPSENALNLIKQFESCSLTAYPDPASKDGSPITIGYGHTGHGIKLGQTITQQEAESCLQLDAMAAAWALHDLQLNQNQFDALVSFVFNIGVGAFRGSHLCRYLEMKNYTAASKEFLKWDHAGGKVVKGLAKRRQAEKELFDTPVSTGGEA